MIGRLRGIIAHKSPPELLLDVGGVFYEIQAPMTSFYPMGDLGEPLTLHTHMVVREDAQLLYGFVTERERSLFRSLIRVNGVGPKLALTILSGIEADVFVACVQDGDSSSLTRIPGIGKKTAERLIIETRDALASWQHKLPTMATTSSCTDDAIAALTALGYKTNDAKRAVTRVAKEGLSSEDVIRLALKEML